MSDLSEVSIKCEPAMRRHVDAVMSGEYALPLRDAPKTVLDIGANVGAFSAWARMLWPTASITAYEPLPGNAVQAGENLNGLGVTLHLAAVRSKSGVGKIYFGRNNCGETSFFQSLKTLDRSVSIKCEAVARVASAEFVKIDTEGCEWEIVQGLDLSATKAICIEAHSWEDASRITGFLNERGFWIHSRNANDCGNFILKFARDGVLRTGQRAFIAVPSYGGLNAWFVRCVMAMQSKPLGDWIYRDLPGDSLVSRARNTLTSQFLETNCTDLLFIDSDLIFSTDHVARILTHDVDVVGGFYPKKDPRGPVQWVCNSLPKTRPRKDGLQEVRYMGTGFLRVRRNVFEALKTEFGKELYYHPDSAPWRTEFDFWRVGVHGTSRRHLSEDWFFCQMCRDIGMRIYGDTQVILKHAGEAVYPLPHQTA